MSPELMLREAQLSDLRVLVRHRRLMFEEMAILAGEPMAEADGAAMDAIYRDYVPLHLARGGMRAWVVEVAGEVVASGAVSFIDWPPGPANPADSIGLCHSVYVDVSHRRRGLARRVMLEVVEDCRRRGVRQVILNATAAARPLYESLGFRPPRDAAMQLAL